MLNNSIIGSIPIAATIPLFVVGGLLSSQKLYPFMYRRNINIEDVDSIKENGIYYVESINTSNAANSFLLVLGNESNLVLQLAYHNSGNGIKVRTLVFGGDWTSWKIYSPA